MRYVFNRDSNGKYGLYDSNTGEYVDGCYFDEVMLPKAFDNQSTLNVMFDRIVVKNGKCGVFSIYPKKLSITIPCEYDVIESAPSAWLMQKNGYWGVYDIKLRKVTLPCICDRIIITEHECKVLRGEEWHTLQR